MALNMCSVVTLMAIPCKLTRYLHNYSLHTKSSKSSYTTVVAAAAARLPPLRCSSQLNGDHHVVIKRRSGNYSPSLWDVNYVQSLDSDYKEEKHKRRASELVMEVKMVVERETNPIRQLELIDDLQRLGLSDHFQDEFKQILSSIYLDHKYYKINDGEMMREEIGDLYSTALAFRLLRQHEVFECFKNEEGEFEASLSDDTKGLLQLYEASFLLTEDEKMLELAREFAANLLQEKLNEIDDDDNLLSLMIKYSLDLPIHWRIGRPNVSVWIDAYKRRPNMNPMVLELAKLDSNVVQAQYQEELKQDLRWWRNTGFVEKLPFARDRLVECYFWTTGTIEPRQYGNIRIMIGKVNALITTIDDVYDVYGTLEELEQFTDVIRRWDITSMDQLPSYMQLCFLALDNFVNDTAYDVLKEKGFNVIPYLRKSWVDLAEAYLVEAKWYYRGHKPKLEEYLDIAWISISAAVTLTHVFFRVTHSFTRDNVDILYQYHDLVRYSSIILRLADDLATSADEMRRGDVPKSVQCYMNENNASEAEARQHVKLLIGETWKKMNEERVRKDSPFCRDFIACAVDLARMAQYMYHDGDAHGMQHPKIHQQMTDCLFQPYA